MKRVADVLADVLVERGLRHGFTVTGGGAMHLNDAFARHEGLETIYCHHEQACAMAAESYARLSGRPALVNVTSGPGGINALNGVFGAYVDSVPMIVVSGQVKRETTVASTTLPLRQLGDQEVDIAAIARPVTKWVTVLDDPASVRAVAEEAFERAVSGRPGPVWIDVPIDVQAAPVDEATLASFGGDAAPTLGPEPLSGPVLDAQLGLALEALARAERPVVLAGAGVRCAGAYETFLEVTEKLGIPVTTGWNAHDLLPDDHPLYVGRPGTVGDRAGNFAVQNADFLLVLGSRLNIRQISYNFQAFARAAYLVMVDVDRAELDKPTLSVDLAIHADLAEALELLSKRLNSDTAPAHRSYLEWCLERRRRYRVTGSEAPAPGGGSDPYYALGVLFDELDEDDIVVCGDGTACVVTFQVARLKAGQRLYTNSGCASMGYDLPAAIGAAIASGSGRVVCVAGDGSIMLNLQELQTIVGRHLEVKVIVLNNDGYSSIRQTQSSYFPDLIAGCDPRSGVTFPDFVKVATAFSIPALRSAGPSDVREAIRQLLAGKGPALLEIVLDRDRPFEPKLSSRRLEDGTMVSAPLEDMAPFLSREELAENVLVARGDDG